MVGVRKMELLQRFQLSRELRGGGVEVQFSRVTRLGFYENRCMVVLELEFDIQYRVYYFQEYFKKFKYEVINLYFSESKNVFCVFYLNYKVKLFFFFIIRKVQFRGVFVQRSRYDVFKRFFLFRLLIRIVVELQFEY